MKKEEFLAMSLPYGMIGITSGSFKTKKLISIHFRNTIICRIQPFDNSIDYPIPFQSFKPILHPISDLTREIEHKGEKFMLGKILVYEISEEWAKVGLSYPNDEDMLLKDIRENLEAVELWMALKLIEYHFDIAGLIEKGEAIDVNTLPENPYK